MFALVYLRVCSVGTRLWNHLKIVYINFRLIYSYTISINTNNQSKSESIYSWLTQCCTDSGYGGGFYKSNFMYEEGCKINYKFVLYCHIVLLTSEHSDTQSEANPKCESNSTSDCSGCSHGWNLEQISVDWLGRGCFHDHRETNWSLG